MQTETPPGTYISPARATFTKLALAISLATSSSLPAATINVDAICTIRNAIIAANTNIASGGCPAGSGADTINMPAGFIEFTSAEVGVDISGASATPVINSEITLQGTNSSSMLRSSLAGTPDFRLLTVTSNGILTINEVDILNGAAASGGGILCSNGTLNVYNSRLDSNSSSMHGGGIAAENCPVTITSNSRLLNNTSGSGGGIHALNSIIQISDSIFSGNQVELNNGGALYIRDTASGSVTNSEFTGNTTDGSGGAVALRSSNITIDGGTMSNNGVGEDGGAISASISTLVLTNSQLSENSANVGRGGAIFGTASTVTVDGANVESNSASSGGGFVVNNSILNISNTRLETNSADSAGAIRSINSSFSFTGNSVLNNYATVFAGGISISNGARPTRLASNTINSNSAGGYAGGMLISNSSNVQMNRDRLINNTSNRTGGLEINSSEVLIERATISSNSASQAGGIRIINTSTVTLSDTSVQGNSATNTVGGIEIASSEITVQRSTIAGNRSDTSAGISAMNGSEINIQNSTISQNSAGFAIGGINLTNSSLSLNHGTVFQNSGGNYASGIYRGGASSSVFLVNSIIAFNGTSDCNTSADTIFQGNWFGDDSCSGEANGDPLLGPLANNGGPTQTHALLENSGAIDLAITGFCQFPVGLVDQRGFQRTGTCDSGAYEYGVSEINFYVIPLPDGKAVVIPL